ncbi:hypothetical protein J2744_000797 [Halorubrum trapanicum]|uniref:Uncharacterized protein n=1 Tax=Halorubrum trapanicum TaxID=29284 RepID=A0A8J7R6L0_9EURY|nr:hypothetical protein [Halorubrum trapanicum]MBP1901139.1 hypothetical protein [Halorubrum trapanicum]
MSEPSTGPDRFALNDSGRVDRAALDAVASRYRRAERLVSWTLALLVTGAFLAAVAALSFWPGVAVGVVLLVALRLPVSRRCGSVRLRTDATPETVVREFASPTPPVLAFQWAVADEVRNDGSVGDATDSDADGGAGASDASATYAFSYLFGLETAEIDLSVEATEGDAFADDDATDGDGSGTERPRAATVEIEGRADGRPWGSYAATVREAADGGSVVDLELRPTRRFDIRRIPQGWVADRYYADALAAQGYEVVERTTSLTR